MNKIIKYSIAVILFLFTPNSFAAWIGPIEVLHGNWGTAVGQFGFVSGDPTDGFPKKIIIDKNNNTIIQDLFNKRVQIYQNNSKATTFSYKELNPGWEIMQWPSDVPTATGFYNNIFVEGGFGKFQYYDYQGNIVNQYKVEDCILKQVNEDGSLIIMNYKTEKYYRYSAIGKLLKTYDTKPLELGIIKEENIGNGKYKITVTYPDKTWEMIQEWGACPEYKRDACGNLYCGTGRFSSTGENLAPNEIIPQNKFEETPISIEYDLGTRIKWIEEYGEPVISPMGDLYTWKRTPDKYSILKWIWVDGPECPQYLNVKSTTNSLKFTWQKPTKDADKITGYQLLQSYNICGPFRQTALLKKDQLSYEDRDVKKGETYYYIVRAVRGKDYSGNSNKVCGQIE